MENLGAKEQDCPAQSITNMKKSINPSWNLKKREIVLLVCQGTVFTLKIDKGNKKNFHPITLSPAVTGNKWLDHSNPWSVIDHSKFQDMVAMGKSEFCNLQQNDGYGQWSRMMSQRVR